MKTETTTSIPTCLPPISPRPEWFYRVVGTLVQYNVELFHAAWDALLLEDVILTVNIANEYEDVYSLDMGIVATIPGHQRASVTVKDNPKPIDGVNGYRPQPRFPDITLQVAGGQFELLLMDDVPYMIFESMYEPVHPLKTYNIHHGVVYSSYEWVGTSEKRNWYVVKADMLRGGS